MKSFDALKTYLGWKEIFARHPEHRKLAGILSKCVYIASLATFFLTSLWYLVTTPETFDEYVNSFYYWSSSVLIAAWYLMFLWNRNKYMVLLCSFDESIGKILWNSIRFWSKSNEFFSFCAPDAQQSTNRNAYERTDNNVEKVLNKIHPIVMYFLIPLFLSIPVMITVFKIVSSSGGVSESSEPFQQIYTASWGHLLLLWIFTL